VAKHSKGALTPARNASQASRDLGRGDFYTAPLAGGALFSLGARVYRARYAVLVLWVVALLASLPLAARVTRSLQPGGLSGRDPESERAADQLRQALGQSAATIVLVFIPAPGVDFGASDRRWAAAEDTALAEVRNLPEVAEVRTRRENARQVAPDGDVSYATVALKSDADQLRTALQRVREALRPTELEVVVTGAPVFYADILEVSERDLQRAELISFPFAAAALLLVFGSLVAAALPAAVGGAAVLTALTAMVLLSRFMDLSVFALNLVTMLGLGLGIDYSLFIVSRFRDELRAHSSPEQAIARTSATAGRAVLFSGLTVFVGLLGLTSFESMALRSMGLCGSLVVLLSVAAALTLLPALLGVLGERVNSFRIRRPDTHPGGFWAALAQRVMRRPGLVFLAVLALLVGLGTPFLRVELGAPDASVLPADVQSRRGFDLLRDHFGRGEQAPILISVEARESIFGSTSIDALYDFVAELRRDPRIERVESLVSLDPRITREQYRLIYAPAAASGRVQSIAEPFARDVAAQTARQQFALVRVTSRYDQTAPESADLVRRIRSVPIGGGLSFAVGGGTAAVVDYTDSLYRDFPRVLLFVVVSTYAILFVLLRSVILPLKAILMNTLSLLASYGALVLVFQEGLLAWLPGFQAVGFVEASLPIIMFCVLFGLSMDYEVFLLARIKEVYDEGADNSTSVAVGLERSGRIITSAALIIVLVSGSFAAADIVLIKALGLGTAIAVLLDATVVRALLVPATMHLLGDWNWWAPGWFRVPGSGFQVPGSGFRVPTPDLMPASPREGKKARK
jgi:RND superfamily putative drug exporter